jgi:hypothetical protein
LRGAPDGEEPDLSAEVSGEWGDYQESDYPRGLIPIGTIIYIELSVELSSRVVNSHFGHSTNR